MPETAVAELRKVSLDVSFGFASLQPNGKQSATVEFQTAEGRFELDVDYSTTPPIAVLFGVVPAK